MACNGACNAGGTRGNFRDPGEPEVGFWATLRAGSGKTPKGPFSGALSGSRRFARVLAKKWRCRDSNPGHADYDSAALTN